MSWLAGQLTGTDAGPPGATVADAIAAFEQDRNERPGPGQVRRAQLGRPSGGSERYAFAALASAAGKVLGSEKGPRIAALELGAGTRTAAQSARLLGPLRQLDAGLVALRDALDRTGATCSPAWTCVPWPRACARPI